MKTFVWVLLIGIATAEAADNCTNVESHHMGIYNFLQYAHVERTDCRHAKSGCPFGDQTTGYEWTHDPKRRAEMIVHFDKVMNITLGRILLDETSCIYNGDILTFLYDNDNGGSDVLCLRPNEHHEIIDPLDEGWIVFGLGSIITQKITVRFPSCQQHNTVIVKGLQFFGPKEYMHTAKAAGCAESTHTVGYCNALEDNEFDVTPGPSTCPTGSMQNFNITFEYDNTFAITYIQLYVKLTCGIPDKMTIETSDTFTDETDQDNPQHRYRQHIVELSTSVPPVPDTIMSYFIPYKGWLTMDKYDYNIDRLRIAAYGSTFPLTELQVIGREGKLYDITDKKNCNSSTGDCTLALDGKNTSRWSPDKTKTSGASIRVALQQLRSGADDLVKYLRFVSYCENETGHLLSCITQVTVTLFNSRGSSNCIQFAVPPIHDRMMFVELPSLAGNSDSIEIRIENVSGNVSNLKLAPGISKIHILEYDNTPPTMTTTTIVATETTTTSLFSSVPTATQEHDTATVTTPPVAGTAVTAPPEYIYICIYILAINDAFWFG